MSDTDPLIQTVREGMALLRSMQASGESSTPSSDWKVAQAFVALDSLAGEIADLRAENERKVKELHASRENCYELDASRREAERLLRVTTDALRREWWLNHGHDYASLYGDDGEMQCSRCHADFKRDPIEKLREVVHAARLERAALAAVEGTGKDRCSADEDGSYPCDPAPNGDGTATCRSCGWTGGWKPEGTAATPGEECPTCGQTGPDTFVRVGDYGGDVWEARCGDEWHDTVSADPRETT